MKTIAGTLSVLGERIHISAAGRINVQKKKILAAARRKEEDEKRKRGHYCWAK